MPSEMTVTSAFTDSRSVRLSKTDDADVALTPEEIALGKGSIHTDLTPAELLVSRATCGNCGLSFGIHLDRGMLYLLSP
jgi:hypothetical protein